MSKNLIRAMAILALVLLALGVAQPQLATAAAFHAPNSTPQVISALPFAVALDSTTVATSSPNDPVMPCGAVNESHFNTEWFTYTPASAQTIVVDTFNSSYDTVLGVWTGAPGSFVSVACNDDATATIQQSAVAFAAASGTTYYIEAASFAPGGGQLALHASATGAGNYLLDGGFEGGTPNVYWQEASTNFGSPLCSTATCPSATGSPKSGTWWASFGGTTSPETASVTQSLIFPSGATRLAFSFMISRADTGATTADLFTAQIDGATVFSANGTQKASFAAYSTVMVDVSAFADGKIHTLSFNSTTSGPIVEFNVDNVGIAQPVSISGNVGLANAGVRLDFNDQGAQHVFADASGNYTLQVGYSWSGTVTPSLTGYLFVPSSTTYTNVTTNLTNQNYQVFGKISPANSSVGTPTSQTLSWMPVPGATFTYCLSSILNDTTCGNGGGWKTTTASSASIGGQTNGRTYYWQVRTVIGGVTYNANNGVWWQFSTATGAFTKTAPVNGASPLTPRTAAIALTWGASAGATSYDYCLTTVVPSAGQQTCDTGWTANASTTKTLSGLLDGTTYYWQVRTGFNGAYTLANTGTWFSFYTQAAFGPGMVDDTDTNIIYTPAANWRTFARAQAYGGSYRYSTTTNDSINFLINSQRFSIVYSQQNPGGTFGVYVDGTLVGNLNTQNAVYADQVSWNSPIIATAGVHAIRIVHTNTTNAIFDAINVWAAPYTQPAAITSLAAVMNTTTAGAVDLTWTAVGADGTTGTAASYDIRYSTAAITTDALFTAATAVATPPAPKVAGTVEHYTVTGLTPGTTYFFAVKAINGRTGPLGNSPSAVARTITITATTEDNVFTAWLYTPTYGPTGNWRSYSYAPASGGSYSYSNTVNDAAQIYVNLPGTSFTIVTAQQSGGGSMQVYVDGVLNTTINTANATYVNQKTFTITTTAGAHLIRIVHSVAGQVIIDAIRIP